MKAGVETAITFPFWRRRVGQAARRRFVNIFDVRLRRASICEDQIEYSGLVLNPRPGDFLTRTAMHRKTCSIRWLSSQPPGHDPTAARHSRQPEREAN